jgi:hypothetical protein
MNHTWLPLLPQRALLAVFGVLIALSQANSGTGTAEQG